MEPIKMALPAMKKKDRRVLFAGGAVLLVLVCCGLVFWLGKGPVDPDARVEGRIVSLASGADGRVGAVLVQEHQLVKAGEPLIRLDDGYFSARLAEARARLDALRMGLAPQALEGGGIRSGSAVAEEAIRARIQAYREQENAARRDVEQLSTDHAKLLLEARRLEAQGGSSAAARDRMNKARLAELSAREALEMAQRRFEAISRARASSDGELVRYRAELAALARMPAGLRESQLASLEAKVREAELDLAAAVIVSPLDGQVAGLAVTVGSAVRRGQTVAVVSPVLPADLWISARFAQADAASVIIGDQCTVTFPDYPNVKLAGVVASTREATAEAALAQNVPGTGAGAARSSGMAVRIAIPDYNAETMPVLQVGMKARVSMGLF